jgi:hypothetical protein
MGLLVCRHLTKEKQMNLLYGVGCACALCVSSTLAIPVGAFFSSLGFTAVAVLAGSLAMVAIFESSCN